MNDDQIVDDLVSMIVKRAEAGKNYGVVMLPEGLIEFIPEFNALISDINDVLASGIPTTIGERTKCPFRGLWCFYTPAPLSGHNGGV